MDIGLLKGHAEIITDLRVAGSNQNLSSLTVRTSLTGLPDPEVGASPFNRLFLQLAEVLIWPFLALCGWQIYKTDKVRRDGMLTLRATGEVLKPMSRWGFATTIVLGTPFFGALATMLVSLVIAAGIDGMLDFGVFD
jgi:hypothetical protein